MSSYPSTTKSILSMSFFLLLCTPIFGAEAEKEKCTFPGLVGEYDQRLCYLFKDMKETCAKLEKKLETKTKPYLKAFLLHGPAGCGKWTAAKEIAKQSGCKIIGMNATALTSKNRGANMDTFRNLLKKAEKKSKKHNQPVLIALLNVDEIATEKNHAENPATESPMIGLCSWINDELESNPRLFFIATTKKDPRELSSEFLSRVYLDKIEIEKPSEEKQRLILNSIIEKDPIRKRVDPEGLWDQEIINKLVKESNKANLDTHFLEWFVSVVYMTAGNHKKKVTEELILKAFYEEKARLAPTQTWAQQISETIRHALG